MFLCQPLLDVLIARGIEDIDSFIQPHPGAIFRIQSRFRG